MFHSSPARWLALFPAVAAMAAAAQPAPPPVLTYRSALEGYRPFTDEKAIPWKEANETVYRRGGWQAYAKEASGAGASEAASPKPATHPAGHSMPMPARKEQP
ncbi:MULTISPECIES: hypothetical protein [unclassified Variovorax]|jgi:hypothetical protein|uniref:hypothetical protein n=1 Tax=unclassified Variovorax TaxID=663243 RepID=UPI000F7F1E9F|nr:MULTISPECIES: hypothetical protein [unclassified Variovorax]RSZ40922.1 hypothetical protein EJO70_13540 [Variovorax sp. 553]RSZ42169.1 hypothetical protein EJO71_15500 [Variovorax sp. 679]